MRRMFGASSMSHVPTGVDIGDFAPPPEKPTGAGLVFVGSMDWAPNVDGMLYFIAEILPRIRLKRPDSRVAIVGRARRRRKSLEAAAGDPLITVTGTVPDVRPVSVGRGCSNRAN